MKKIVG
jgi:hypothetical protein